MILAIIKKFLFISFCFSIFCFSSKPEELSQLPAKLMLISKYTGFSQMGGGVIGLWFKMEPGWHTYWKNPGDTGLPPAFTWTKPEDLQIGEGLWLLPEKIVQEGIVTFGYEKETLVLFPINWSHKSKLTKDELIIEVAVQYLVCQKICLTLSTNLSINLKVNELLAPSRFSDIFLKYEKNIPTDGSKWIKQVQVKKNSLKLTLDAYLFRGSEKEINKFDFFPEEEGLFNLNEIKINYLQDVVITLPFAPGGRSDLKKLKQVEGVFGKSLKNNIGGNGVEETQTNPRPLHLILEIESSSWMDLLLSLLYAFIGGIILNAMPCVFPVLSLKAMTIAQMGEDDKGRLKHGLSFSFGVIITFCLLAIIILLFKQSGTALGWGFHLQSPVFVVLMIFLFIALSLNLLGWYEMGLSIVSFFGEKMGGKKDGELGGFLTGVLSTLLATPCTAPFMGTAVGYSLAKGWAHTLVVFIALGIGMAIPFFLLCVIPKANKCLPKPGVWMQTFKHLMAFPLIGTALWLFWVWQQQTGLSGVPAANREFNQDIRLLTSVLIFSFALWLYGQGVQLSRRKISKILFSIIVLLLLGFSLKTGIDLSDSSSKSFNKKDQLANSDLWETFDKKKLNEYLSQNFPVLIDFTARWCITCQVNKKMAFSPESIKQELEEKGVVLIRADWTDYDPRITEALATYGRSSIPLNVLYVPGQKEPELLPAILTASILRSYLKKIPSKKP